jgi:hypothetical protein
LSRIGQERLFARTVGDHRAEGGRGLRDPVLKERDGNRGQGTEGRVEVHVQVGLRLCDRGQGAGERLESAEEAAEVGLARREIRGDRTEVADQRQERPDRVVDVAAATGQGVAEADRRLLNALPSRRIEHREHLVEVDFGRALGERNRRIVRIGLLGVAGDDLQVLEPDGSLQAHVESRVHRQRLDHLVELQVEHGDRLPVGGACRADRVDQADERAADVHLGSMGELGGIGDLDVQRVLGDERKPIVGLVGQRDGHDRGQYRERADQDRVAEHPRLAPRPCVHC